MRIAKLLALVLLLWTPKAFAKTFPAMGPIPIRNQNPLALLQLDMRPQGTKILKHNQFLVETDFAYSNLFERQASEQTGYQLALDMEILRHAYHFRYGLLDKYEFGIEIPFIHTSSGFLDPLIEGFHNTFGLPNAGRQNFPDNTFSNSLTQNGTTVYSAGEQAYGLSDIILDFKHEILKEGKYTPGFASIFYLKLPTGQHSKGLGSGSPDFGLQLAVQKSYKRLHGYFNLGYLVFGPNNSLEALTNRTMASWMFAGEVSIIQKYLSGILQISGDTSLFEGANMHTVDEGALNLTTGFAGQAWNGHSWKLAFAEDPNASDISVDFTLWFQWAYEF